MSDNAIERKIVLQYLVSLDPTVDTHSLIMEYAPIPSCFMFFKFLVSCIKSHSKYTV